MHTDARKHWLWRGLSSPPPPGLATCRTWQDRTGDGEDHDHDFFEVVLITAGHGVHHCAHGDQPLKRGTFVVLRPGAWHAYRACHGLAGYDLCFVDRSSQVALPAIFDDPLLAMLLMTGPMAPRRYGVMVGMLPDGDRSPCQQAMEALETLNALDQHSECTYAIERTGAFLVALGRIARAAGLTPTTDRHGSGSHPATAAAARLLEADLTRDWDMPDLAREAGLEISALTRRFRRAYGLPPLAWLNRRRAERAAALLVTTDLPISEIGAAVGWLDASYFSRRFRAATGMTPSDHRLRFQPQ
jgi:AraC family L-rhamnose operon transcriptional activator RhaR